MSNYILTFLRDRRFFTRCIGICGLWQLLFSVSQIILMKKLNLTQETRNYFFSNRLAVKTNKDVMEWSSMTSVSLVSVNSLLFSKSNLKLNLVIYLSRWLFSRENFNQITIACKEQSFKHIHSIHDALGYVSRFKIWFSSITRLIYVALSIQSELWWISLKFYAF